MIEVLPAKPQDAEKLHEIFVQAALYKHRYDDHSWRNGFSLAGVMHMIENGDTYTVYLEDKPVATVGLEWEDDGWDDDPAQNAGYIHRLAVADGYHGKQIGEQIIDWAANQVAQKGRHYLSLDCNVNNPSLCAYYEKQGFKQVQTKHFPDFDYTAALFQRRVK